MRHKPLAILHIPHASKLVPLDVRQTFLLSDDELEAEILRITDSFTDELFDCNHSLAGKIVYPVSRLVADVERFLDDNDEPMAKVGMGVIYTKTSTGQTLRRSISAEDRAAVIKKYYEPHHKKLADTVSNALKVYRRCLIIDCHSFESLPLACEPHQSSNRPDICIGTDSYHTPQWLSDLAVDLFEQAGLSVEVNSPFAGTLVPLGYYHLDENVYSIMFELYRSLYMDESSGKRNAHFTRVHNTLQPILRQIIDAVFQTNWSDQPQS